MSSATGASEPDRILRVLVVEEFDPLRTLFVRVLGLDGYQVTAAATAAAALSRSSNESFDLLVTDVSLPDGHGSAIAREVIAQNPGIRVLYTSDGSVAGVDLDIPGTPTALLAKPIDIDELTAQVRDLLAVQPDD